MVVKFESRAFNRVVLDSKQGLITKRGTRREIQDEVFWYENIPQSLECLTPKLIESDDDSYKLEYIEWPTLSSLYISEALTLTDWKKAIKGLFLITEDFKKFPTQYTGVEKQKSLHEMLVAKTLSRCNGMRETSFWDDLLNYEKIIVNNKEMLNFRSLMQCASDKIEEITNTAYFCFIHGDLSIANIFFNSVTGSFKLVDPRGRFAQRRTCDGDIQYDIAKLSHCFNGYYDLLIDNRFVIKENAKKSFSFTVQTNSYFSQIKSTFNNTVCEYGYNPEHINIIEGLLFLSMIPLHYENKQRQLAFYLNAIQILNNAVTNEKKN